MEMRDYLAAEDKQFRAHLEEHQKVIGGVLGEVKAQGNRIAQEAAQAVKAAGQEAVAQAQASLDQMAQAAQQVGDLARQASETTAKAAQQTGELLGKVDQASQRMVTSEQKVEAALDGLLPKVATIREGLEKELGSVVKATTDTEAEVRKIVAAIRSSMTKEIEKEIREKLGKAADHATQRIYSLGAWWDNFHRIGVYAAMGFGMLATGICGWWYGKHQLEEGIYGKKAQELKVNTQVIVWSHKFSKELDGSVSHNLEAINAPLVWLGGGKFALMTKNKQDQWTYGDTEAAKGTLELAEVYDSSKDNKNNTIKEKKF